MSAKYTHTGKAFQFFHVMIEKTTTISWRRSHQIYHFWTKQRTQTTNAFLVDYGCSTSPRGSFCFGCLAICVEEINMSVYWIIALKQKKSGKLNTTLKDPICNVSQIDWVGRRDENRTWCFLPVSNVAALNGMGMQGMHRKNVAVFGLN